MRGRMAWQSEGWPGTVPWLEIDLATLGLVVVDMQYACAHPDWTPTRVQRDRNRDAFDDWVRRIDGVVVPNTQRLLSWFRSHSRPVIFTRVGSLLPDGQDQHPKRRLAWHRPGRDLPPQRCSVGSAEYEVLEVIAPVPGELAIDKNASGAFNSSAIDFYLHQLGLRTLVIGGVSTFACVDNTARDAADRGYNVIIVEDACAGAAGSGGAHDATLRTFGRYLGAVKRTEQLLAELDRLVAAAPALAATGG